MSTFYGFVYTGYCGSIAILQMHSCRLCSNTVAANNSVAFFQWFIESRHHLLIIYWCNWIPQIWMMRMRIKRSFFAVWQPGIEARIAQAPLAKIPHGPSYPKCLIRRPRWLWSMHICWFKKQDPTLDGESNQLSDKWRAYSKAIKLLFFLRSQTRLSPVTICHMAFSQLNWEVLPLKLLARQNCFKFLLNV